MSEMNDEKGRVPSAPGSREPGSQAIPALSGFDPARGPAETPSHTVIIGWPTIERVAREGAVWFDDLQVGLVAASDLFGVDVAALCAPQQKAASAPLAGREEVARIIANAVGKPLDPAKSPMGRLSDPLPKDWLRAADAILALISPAETLDRAEAAGAWRPAVLALKNCADAVDFYDRTQAATEAERAAVGADAWQWIMEACRRAAKVAPPLSTEEGAR